MIRCTLYGSPVAIDTNVTMISDVCPAHPACALPWGCAVDVAVSGPARLQACGLLPPLFYGMFTLCNQVHPAVAVKMPTPQGMPLTASHAPLLTLHMLWVDLSK